MFSCLIQLNVYLKKFCDFFMDKLFPLDSGEENKETPEKSPRSYKDLEQKFINGETNDFEVL